MLGERTLRGPERYRGGALSRGRGTSPGEGPHPAVAGPACAGESASRGRPPHDSARQAPVRRHRIVPATRNIPGRGLIPRSRDAARGGASSRGRGTSLRRRGCIARQASVRRHRIVPGTRSIPGRGLIPRSRDQLAPARLHREAGPGDLRRLAQRAGQCRQYNRRPRLLVVPPPKAGVSQYIRYVPAHREKAPIDEACVELWNFEEMRS